MSVSAFSDVVRARVMARSGGFCEVRVNGCWDEGSQYHHRRPRGMGGSRSSVSGGAANCLFVCLPCHNALETVEPADQVSYRLVDERLERRERARARVNSRTGERRET